MIYELYVGKKGPCVLNEFLLVTSHSPLITQMQIIIEISAANKPEYLIRIVRTYICMGCKLNNGFKQLVVVRLVLAKVQGGENIAKMDIGLREVDIAHLFEKVTRQGKTKSFYFSISKRGGTCPYRRVS